MSRKLRMTCTGLQPQGRCIPSCHMAKSMRGVSQDKEDKEGEHLKLNEDRICLSIWVRNRKCQPGHYTPGLELRT